MAKFVVAIDGGAGSGKSTTAKGVAERLNFFYLDTGAMYRAVTLKYLRLTKDTDMIDMDIITKIVGDTTIDLRRKDAKTFVYLDRSDVTQDIRSPAVNNFVSQISAIPQVREWMVERQREIAEGKNVVCEGRDIGTVVFPDAQVKVYMRADLEVRAKRRLQELAEKKIAVNLNDILKNLKFRDQYDSKREHSPLKKADTAVVIDTTHITIKEEIDIVEKIVQNSLKRNIDSGDQVDSKR